MIDENKKRKILSEFKNFIETNNIKITVSKKLNVCWIFIDDEFICSVSEINPKQVETFCEHCEMYEDEEGE